MIIHKLSEKQWQAMVMNLCHVYGWRVAHFRPSLNQRGRWQTAVSGDGAGFPDLVLAHPSGDLIFAELKSEKGVLSPEQKLWAEVLGDRFVLWKPSQFEAVRERLYKPKKLGAPDSIK